MHRSLKLPNGFRCGFFKIDSLIKEEGFYGHNIYNIEVEHFSISIAQLFIDIKYIYVTQTTVNLTKSRC
jgi:hypothetical protein